MDEYSLTVAISALANAIAAQTPDNAELNVLATIFDQLGDTLDTIVAMRELEAKRNFGSSGE